MKFPILLLATMLVAVFYLQFDITTAQEDDRHPFVELHFSPSAIQPGVAKYSIGYVSVLNSDGQPILAPEDLEISLVSKNSSIASVPSTVVIPQNEGYAKFDITIGELEGETEISAIYQDQIYPQKFRVGGINVEVPLAVDLEIAIPTQEMHVGTEIPMSVFLNNQGTILQAPKDIKVSLEYDHTLLNLENNVIIIEKGNYYATNTITALEKPGSAFIKATTESPLLDTFKNITLTSTYPSKLQVNVFPEHVIKQKDREIDIFVSLLDDNDFPTVATKDVKLELFSNVDPLDDELEKEFQTRSAVIKRGEWGFYYRQDNILFQDVSKRNFVGALAPGYGLAQGPFEVVEELDNKNIRAENQTVRVYQLPLMPPDSTAIVVYQISAIKGDDDDQTVIEDMIEDGDLEEHPFDDDDVYEEFDLYPILPDFDAFNSDDKTGRVVSSNSDIVKVINPGIMSGKSSYATAIIKSGTINGDVTISAAIKGIGSGSNVTLVANLLSQDKTMIFSPAGDGKIVFNSEGLSDLYIVALDSSGQPTSSKNNLEYLVEPINTVAEIKPEDTFSKMRIKSSSFVKQLEIGNATITVNPVGADIQQSLTKTSSFEIAPSSSTVKIILPFDTIVANQQVHPLGIVQLVDFFGNPVIVTNDLKVELNSNNTQMATVPPNVTIQAGNSFVEFPITTFGNAGNTTISSTARGLFGSTLELKQTQFIKNLSIFPVYQEGALQVNQAAEVQIFVDDQNTASVNDALLVLTPDQNSTVFPQTINTDENGEANVLFTPSAGPTASLTIHASKFGYIDDETTITFDTVGFVVEEKTLFGIPPWMLYIAIAGAVGGIAVVLLRILRKPKELTEEEAAEEEI